MELSYFGFFGFFFEQRQEHQFGIANNRYIDFDVFANLRRINVDMHNRRIRGKGGRLTGDAVIEAPADIEQKVAFLDGAVGMHPTMHPWHPQRQGVVLWEGTKAVQRRNHGDLITFGKSHDFVAGIGHHNAVTNHHDWFFALEHQIKGGLDLFFATLVGGPITRQKDFFAVIRDD